MTAFPKGLRPSSCPPIRRRWKRNNGQNGGVSSGDSVPPPPSHGPTAVPFLLFLPIQDPIFTRTLPHVASGQFTRLPRRLLRFATGQAHRPEARARARARPLGLDVVPRLGLRQELRLARPRLHGAVRRRFRHERVAPGLRRVDPVGIGHGEGGVGVAELPIRPQGLQFAVAEASEGV